MTITKAQKPMGQTEYWLQRENIHTSFVLSIITTSEAVEALERLSLSPDHSGLLLRDWTDERALGAIHDRFMRRAISLVDAAYELEQLSFSRELAGQLLNDWEDYRSLTSFAEAREA